MFTTNNFLPGFGKNKPSTDVTSFSLMSRGASPSLETICFASWLFLIISGTHNQLSIKDYLDLDNGFSCLFSKKYFH